MHYKIISDGQKSYKDVQLGQWQSDLNSIIAEPEVDYMNFPTD